MSLAISAPAPFCLAENETISYVSAPASPSVFLHGGVKTVEVRPGFCPGVLGLGTYQQAWYALGNKQYKLAADMFQIAGDQMETSAGVSRFLAEARFAEAQTRRLMGQTERANILYKRAIALFEQTDSQSFYLKAAREALKDPAPATLSGQVKKNNSHLKLMPLPAIEKVAGNIKLSAQASVLDTGISINTLHNGDFFNRSRGTLMQTAAADISDEYARNVIHTAFLKMNCQETAAVGATNYTAPLFYKPILSDGKPVAVGAGTVLLSPTAELNLNGKTYQVSMDLPHISANSRNVLLVTDGRNVLAIDPRTSDAWKLCANFSGKIPEFNWWKLGRQKERKFS